MSTAGQHGHVQVLAHRKCSFCGGSGPPLNTWFLGQSRVYIPNCISVGLSAFAGFPPVTNRQTDTQIDHARCVTIGHILCYALRCGLIIIACGKYVREDLAIFGTTMFYKLAESEGSDCQVKNN